jgi:adenosyl cobinamide kinase/adenosyl cobinamide phosphate guanylyltransferase
VSSLRPAATLACFCAASFDTFLVGGDLGCRRVPLHRLDRCPADQFGALFDDVSAVHDGVGLAVARHHHHLNHHYHQHY